jgi:DNA-binding MarR family transcriptional regulator
MDDQRELPPALADELGYLLGRAHAVHRARVEEALAPFALGVKAFGALSLLVTEGPLSQRRLGERQGIDRSTMVAVVDELEREGLVERRRDAIDRRAYALHATPEGRRRLPRARKAAARAEDEALASLSQHERARLKRLLAAVVAATPAAAPPRP